MTERDPLSLNGRTIAEKYRVERLVGEGGFAVVYRAIHTIWNKPVAIKFFNGLSSAPADQREQFQQAFIQEGALLTELSSSRFGVPLASGAYVVGLLATAAHAGLGTHRALLLEGLLDAPGRRQASARACAAFGVLLFALGAAAVIRVASGVLLR